MPPHVQHAFEARVQQSIWMLTYCLITRPLFVVIVGSIEIDWLSTFGFLYENLEAFAHMNGSKDKFSIIVIVSTL